MAGWPSALLSELLPLGLLGEVNQKHSGQSYGSRSKSDGKDDLFPSEKNSSFRVVNKRVQNDGHQTHETDSKEY